MAIGLSLMFGIRLPLNFNSPYKAVSIIDFWRRWHMTLSRFLRDYLYIPLGGGRRGAARRYVNLLITMLLGGLWHGAGWTFVIWGGLHGVYLIAAHGWRAIRGQPAGDAAPPAAWRRGGSWLLTFLAVVVAWVFFRAASLDAALRMLAGMSGANGFAAPGDLAEVAQALVFVPILADLGQRVAPGGIMAVAVAALLAVAWFAPNTQEMMGAHGRAIDPYPDPGRRAAPALVAPTPAVAVAVGAVLFASLLGLLTETPSEFLYFQF